MSDACWANVGLNIEDACKHFTNAAKIFDGGEFDQSSTSTTAPSACCTLPLYTPDQAETPLGDGQRANLQRKRRSTPARPQREKRLG
jgi:hypothetical protein